MSRRRGGKEKTKHQHWVPQFYLRYFATPETRDTETPQVNIFSKDPDDGDEKLTSVRNVCGKRYLYSPIQPSGERSWALDERLDDLESLLGRIWPELARGFAPLDDESLRKGVALFVAIMHLRNPEVRKAVERIHQQLVAFCQTVPLGADGSPAISSVEINGEVREFDTSDWASYRRWGKDAHDRLFADLIQSEAANIAELLLKKRWSVVFSQEDTFITTDKPVVVSHPSRTTAGFRTAGAMVSFPLSPTRLLVMDDLHDQPANQYYPLQEPKAGAFNFTLWHGASRFMVTGRPVPEVLGEICSLADDQNAA